MNLELQQFKNIDLADVFFDSLKEDYSEFPEWFAKKAENFAYVYKSDDGTIDGFLYLKVEEDSISDVTPAFLPARRLKIGTMKINAHGTKLGERFLKKIFDHALFESVEEIYVTVFPKQISLIALFERYGFKRQATKTTANGTEFVLVRKLRCQYTDVVTSYPLVNLDKKRVYLLSIHPKWHTRLLPDSILNSENSDVVQDISHTNSIHKVYLANMSGMESLTRGDILLIYRTGDGQGPAHYRSVATSICVVEEYRTIHSFTTCDEFLSYCNPYSVFSEDELSKFWSTKKYPHIIRFTYNIALIKRVTRSRMIEEIGIDGAAYWGFLPLSHQQFISICSKGQIDESLIIN